MLHDLTLYQKSYEFLFWIKQVVQKFAKAHKYALGIQLENEMLELVKAIVRANRARDKRPYIEECFVRYETVRMLVRVCKDFKLITVRQYEFASEKLAEIGRMLGGWQKYSAAGGGRFDAVPSPRALLERGAALHRICLSRREAESRVRIEIQAASSVAGIGIMARIPAPSRSI